MANVLFLLVLVWTRAIFDKLGLRWPHTIDAIPPTETVTVVRNLFSTKTIFRTVPTPDVPVLDDDFLNFEIPGNALILRHDPNASSWTISNARMLEFILFYWRFWLIFIVLIILAFLLGYFWDRRRPNPPANAAEDNAPPPSGPGAQPHTIAAPGPTDCGVQPQTVAAPPPSDNGAQSDAAAPPPPGPAAQPSLPQQSVQDPGTQTDTRDFERMDRSNKEMKKSLDEMTAKVKSIEGDRELYKRQYASLNTRYEWLVSKSKGQHETSSREYSQLEVQHVAAKATISTITAQLEAKKEQLAITAGERDEWKAKHGTAETGRALAVNERDTSARRADDLRLKLEEANGDIRKLLDQRSSAYESVQHDLAAERAARSELEGRFERERGEWQRERQELLDMANKKKSVKKNAAKEGSKLAAPTRRKAPATGESTLQDTVEKTKAATTAESIEQDSRAEEGAGRAENPPQDDVVEDEPNDGREPVTRDGPAPPHDDGQKQDDGDVKGDDDGDDDDDDAPAAGSVLESVDPTAVSAPESSSVQPPLIPEQTPSDAPVFVVPTSAPLLEQQPHVGTDSVTEEGHAPTHDLVVSGTQSAVVDPTVTSLVDLLAGMHVAAPGIEEEVVTGQQNSGPVQSLPEPQFTVPAIVQEQPDASQQNFAPVQSFLGMQITSPAIPEQPVANLQTAATTLDIDMSNSGTMDDDEMEDAFEPVASNPEVDHNEEMQDAPPPLRPQQPVISADDEGNHAEMTDAPPSSQPLQETASTTDHVTNAPDQQFAPQLNLPGDMYALYRQHRMDFQQNEAVTDAMDVTPISAPSTTAPSTTAPSTTAPSTTAPSTTAPPTTAPPTTEPPTNTTVVFTGNAAACPQAVRINGLNLPGLGRPNDGGMKPCENGKPGHAPYNGYLSKFCPACHKCQVEGCAVIKERKEGKFCRNHRAWCEICWKFEKSSRTGLCPNLNCRKRDIAQPRKRGGNSPQPPKSPDASNGSNGANTAPKPSPAAPSAPNRGQASGSSGAAPSSQSTTIGSSTALSLTRLLESVEAGSSGHRSQANGTPRPWQPPQRSAVPASEKSALVQPASTASSIAALLRDDPMGLNIMRPCPVDPQGHGVYNTRNLKECPRCPQQLCAFTICFATRHPDFDHCTNHLRDCEICGARKVPDQECPNIAKHHEVRKIAQPRRRLHPAARAPAQSEFNDTIPRQTQEDNESQSEPSEADGPRSFHGVGHPQSGKRKPDGLAANPPTKKQITPQSEDIPIDPALLDDNGDTASQAFLDPALFSQIPSEQKTGNGDSNGPAPAAPKSFPAHFRPCNFHSPWDPNFYKRCPNCDWECENRSCDEQCLPAKNRCAKHERCEFEDCSARPDADEDFCPQHIVLCMCGKKLSVCPDMGRSGHSDHCSICGEVKVSGWHCPKAFEDRRHWDHCEVCGLLKMMGTVCAQSKYHP